MQPQFKQGLRRLQSRWACIGVILLRGHAYLGVPLTKEMPGAVMSNAGAQTLENLQSWVTSKYSYFSNGVEGGCIAGVHLTTEAGCRCDKQSGRSRRCAAAARAL